VIKLRPNYVDNACDGRRFRVIGSSYLPKVTNFNLPHVYLAPPLKVTPFEFYAKIFGIRKLETLGYHVALFV